MTDLVNWQRIEIEMDCRPSVERYRNPLRVEVVRHLVPFVGAAIIIGVILGYGWRMAQG